MKAIPAPRITASRRVRRELRRRARAGRAQARVVQRARIVLLGLDGHCGREIGRRVGVHPSLVQRWLVRFGVGGLNALEDAPRSGRPPTITKSERTRVLSMACRKPEAFGEERSLWTLTSLARCAVRSGRVRRIGRSEVHRILQDAELRPHKVRMWCTSNDPDYDAKMADVTGLYLDPPPDEPVLCFDEKSQMQALSRRVPLRRATPGQAGRQESDYERHGTRCLLACFDVRTGKVIGRMTDQRRSVEFLSFLDLIARMHPSGRVHVVLDNLNTHYGPAVEEWNRAHGQRFLFHYTPYHASWLNQIEVFFSILQRRVLRHGEFGDVGDLDRAVTGFLRRWNRDEAHPFRWSYRAEKRVA